METRIKILVSTSPISFRPIYRFLRPFLRTDWIWHSNLRSYSHDVRAMRERKKKIPGNLISLALLTKKFLMISLDLFDFDNSLVKKSKKRIMKSGKEYGIE